MTLSQLAQITFGQLVGDNCIVGSISIDSRKLQSGEVYIALIGENHDGHDFIQSAIDAGASAIITDRALDCSVPYIKVEDTTQALQNIAVNHRNEIDVKTIAVTGSCGKTTTRAFLKQVFSQDGNTHSSKGSFNNHIGVPLTLLELKPEHDYFIAELGANHVGEIGQLVPLVKPDVAIITNVGPAHLEGFGTLENIAETKGDIYSGLTSDGTAIVNNDDRFASYWRHLNHGRHVITFGIKHDADVMADNIIIDDAGYASFSLVLPETVVDIKLSIIGEHNIANALAAAAAGYALGLSAQQIKKGLELTTAESKRLVEHRLSSGACLIDDSYNANPLSTEAALKLLVKRPGESVFVFGDMKELGADEQALHVEIGEKAKQMGLTYLYCYGDLAKATAAAFGEGAHHFKDKQTLIDTLKKAIHSDQTILVKGSRSMKMEEVIDGLVAKT